MSTLLDWLVQHEPLFRKPRLPSLYSDLSVQRTSNPDGFAANVTAWRSALQRATVAGQLPAESRLTLHTNDELLNSLASAQYGRPSGLGAVIDDCVREGNMVDLDEFLHMDRSLYHKSWVPSPWSVLKWALRQAGISTGTSYDIAGRLRVGHLVLVQVLEEVSRQMLAEQAKSGYGLSQRIVAREAFPALLGALGGETASKQDIDVLLKYLYRDKQALSYDDKTIKFKAPTELAPEPITQEDATIANLKFLISQLSYQTETLQARVSSLQSMAQSWVKAGNKHAALSALRSKKLAERNLAQRTETLHQLEETFSKIETAADQVQIIAAMKESSGVLKALNAKVGGVEGVDAVMDDLREQLGTADEVTQAMQEPLASNGALNDAEVDEEFEEMEAEETRRKDAVEAAERDKIEARQAEETRKRLEGLQTVSGKPDEEKGDDAQIAKTGRTMSQMNIEEGAARPNDEEHSDRMADAA